MFWMDRKQMILAAILVCAIVFGAGYRAAQVKAKAGQKPVITVNPGETREKEKTHTVTVHVTGAVKKPGVYTFSEGARVIDAIYKSGRGGDADLNYINLAEIMTDQQQIAVPRKGEEQEYANPPGSQSSGSTAGGGLSLGPAGNRSTRSGKININTAGAAVLDNLPGIGPAMAQRIIDYRQEHGRFKSTSELLQVSGIGEKKFAELKDQVTI
ncbi:MAG: competence protein ComEA [Firmicutes bacterium HGW-Firmicutes-8]|nr:MAG: competence protein ComEA [Firmicutes bacterium HGW-Firmicutes-8]